MAIDRLGAITHKDTYDKHSVVKMENIATKFEMLAEQLFRADYECAIILHKISLNHKLLPYSFIDFFFKFKW